MELCSDITDCVCVEWMKMLLFDLRAWIYNELTVVPIEYKTIS